jgi:autotransporter family porin
VSGGRTAGIVWARRATLLATVTVLAACSSSTPQTTLPPATTAPTGSTSPIATTPPSSDAPSSSSPRTGPQEHFGTLPVGAVLPSDADCAARVRPAPEVRADNAQFNRTPGSGPPANPPGPLYARVTGDFTGTTDEIIQWAACKWGIDEDIVRAQAAKESYWNQDAAGDFTSDPSTCAPGQAVGANHDHPDECAESVGLMQVRYPYWGWAFPAAGTSSAYNLDVALAGRRNCFEGNDAWLNTADRGKDYAAGDIWGCVGTWFSGRWYTADSNTYIAAVQDYLDERVWEQSDFINYR